MALPLSSLAAHRRVALPAVLAAAALAGPAMASEIYLQAGVPGVGLGFAQPLSGWLGVRGDFVTLGTRDRNTTSPTAGSSRPIAAACTPICTPSPAASASRSVPR